MHKLLFTTHWMMDDDTILIRFNTKNLVVSIKVNKILNILINLL